MTDQAFAVLFTAGTFLFALLVYLAYMQWRRARYRALADALGAQYLSCGIFNTGEIAGSCNGRSYKIQTKSHGRGGMWTAASLPCQNRGILLSVFGSFFKSFPAWKYAFANDGAKATTGLRLALSDFGSPLEDKYKSPVEGLLQQTAFAASEVFRKGHLRIERDFISFTRHGVVTEAESTRQLLAQLAEIAIRIEADPIL